MVTKQSDSAGSRGRRLGEQKAIRLPLGCSGSCKSSLQSGKGCFWKNNWTRQFRRSPWSLRLSFWLCRRHPLFLLAFDFVIWHLHRNLPHPLQMPHGQNVRALSSTPVQMARTSPSIGLLTKWINCCELLRYGLISTTAYPDEGYKR